MSTPVVTHRAGVLLIPPAGPTGSAWRTRRVSRRLRNGGRADRPLELRSLQPRLLSGDDHFRDHGDDAGRIGVHRLGSLSGESEIFRRSSFRAGVAPTAFLSYCWSAKPSRFAQPILPLARSDALKQRRPSKEALGRQGRINKLTGKVSAVTRTQIQVIFAARAARPPRPAARCDRI
jgi:hypothetical protein